MHETSDFKNNVKDRTYERGLFMLVYFVLRVQRSIRGHNSFIFSSFSVEPIWLPGSS